MTLTSFDFPSAVRIADVVRKVEGEPQRTRPLIIDGVPSSGGRRVFRVCTFTGSWAINTVKTVTLKYTTATPNTLVSTNLFAEIAATTTAARSCAIARDGTAWYLIAAEC